MQSPFPHSFHQPSPTAFSCSPPRARSLVTGLSGVPISLTGGMCPFLKMEVTPVGWIVWEWDRESVWLDSLVSRVRYCFTWCLWLCCMWYLDWFSKCVCTWEGMEIIAKVLSYWYQYLPICSLKNLQNNRFSFNNTWIELLLTLNLFFQFCTLTHFLFVYYFPLTQLINLLNNYQRKIELEEINMILRKDQKYATHFSLLI